MSGHLRDGAWHPGWYDTKASGGRFLRHDAAFRGWVRSDGGGEFPAAAGRYHLYVSLACPWAHRTLIMRSLKGLDDVCPCRWSNPSWVRKGGGSAPPCPTR